MRSSLVTASVLAVFATSLLATSAMARHVSPLPSRKGWDQNAKHFVAPPGGASGTWSGLLHTFPGAMFPDTALVMTNGTVLMHDGCTINWFRLTPDANGNYQKGTWTSVPSMPSGYSPLYFSSAVLSDGKLIVNGGEYTNCNANWTNKGAIYDPVANTWTNVPPPSGFANIGDAQSTVLPNGGYMMANALTTQQAIGTVSGTTVTWTPTGTGKADRNDEEGWTALPDNSIITVDANRDLGAPNDVEFYSLATGAWTTASEKTPVSLVDASSHELGPAPLLPNGLVFQLGATVHNAVYDHSTGHWTAAPDTPNVDGALDSADGPAVVLPNGNVLEQVSPGVFNAPSHFFEVQVTNPTHVTFTQVSEPASAASQSSYEGRLVMLPTGQALWSSDVGDVQIYTPASNKPFKGTKPKITRVKTTLAVGSKKNALTGKKLNGFTFGGYYGDDAEMATNYPLVRFINNSSGHVCYGFTYGFSKMGIDDGTPTSAKFDIPASCETGASKMEVVVNGVASKAKNVTLN